MNNDIPLERKIFSGSKGKYSGDKNKANWAVWALVLLFVVLIVVWWFFSDDPKTIKRKESRGRTDFSDIEDDFELRSERFYMSNDFISINDELQNSDYTYTIFDSNGKLLYNNRSFVSLYETREHTKLRSCDSDILFKNLIISFESTQAISTMNKGFILRNKVRNAAFYVSDCKDRARIVHISSNNAELQQVLIF